MGPSRHRGVLHSDLAEQEFREQEVRRANRELAAYFRGQRTEREARAALKIIKAFIRERERIDLAKRRPLPAALSAKVTPKDRKRKKAMALEKVGRRGPRHQVHDGTSTSADARDVSTTKPEPPSTGE